MHDYMFMQGVYLGGLAVWDDATLLWTSSPLAGPAPGPRAHPGLAAGPGGGIYLFGGDGPQGV